MSYPIVTIPADAREDTEQLGSKPKFWVLLDGRRWLFKEARPDTGEDWAEKAAAEVAKAIGINAATVDLAEYAGRRGSISLNFVDVQAGQALVHGNEILATSVSAYDRDKTFRQSDHTLQNIETAIRELFPHDRADAALNGRWSGAVVPRHGARRHLSNSGRTPWREPAPARSVGRSSVSFALRSGIGPGCRARGSRCASNR